MHLALVSWRDPKQHVLATQPMMQWLQLFHCALAAGAECLLVTPRSVRNWQRRCSKDSVHHDQEWERCRLSSIIPTVSILAASSSHLPSTPAGKRLSLYF